MLVAVRDVRVRRALSGLLEVAGDQIVGATDSVHLLPELDAQVAPDVVVLELSRRDEPQDLQVIDRLARRGRVVIAVCSGLRRCDAALAVGASACLDKDAGFTDRLGEAVRGLAVKETSSPPQKRRLRQED